LAVDAGPLGALARALAAIARLDQALHGHPLLPDGLRIIERGAILDAARAAFALHQWISAPDFDQEGEVHVALAHLSVAPCRRPRYWQSR
jgi:hypothetical protein